MSHPVVPSSRSRRALSPWGILLCLTALLALPLAVSAADDPAQRVNDYLKGLKSLQANFEQFTFNAQHTRMSKSHGKFYVQRPGKFRWEYDDPIHQVIIADGKRVYLHDIDLDQVSQQSQDKALQGTPALLLTSDGPIQSQFTVKSLPATDGRDWVELTPKAKDSEVQRIELGFKGKELDTIMMQDSFGQDTRLNFTNVRRNPQLDASLFKIDTSTVNEFINF